MAETLGARLRQQREERQIALSTISEKTKIKQSLLEALERDDISQWPTGIFRRAFVRAYAEAIGLQADEIVREFLELNPDPVEAASLLAPLAAAAEARGSSAPPTRLRQMVGSAVDSLKGMRSAHGQRPQTAPEHPSGPVATPQSVVEPVVAAATVPVGDLLAVADLCTMLTRARRTDDLSPLLEDAARILEATGLIVWTWDAAVARLRPSWAHGYSDVVLSHLPKVSADADNATAAAFRSARTSYVAAAEHACAALVAPLLTAQGCVGVLAIELEPARDNPGRSEALATIVAAQLARIVDEPVEKSDVPHVDLPAWRLARAAAI